MARINLRDYLKGVEEMIDSGQTEDALAHCRHILTSFPKHIDTYRLMGKAYLEAKRHSEASDIFQRVLSSAPDDFVAHIGMSIIREDESNQDAAIWHMERAFESQPSNRAVQDELRRLYGKREGYELPKVRLTRGALARMYAHGDLYNQAIGELRGALGEDSQRPDLQVLLAEMYFNTKQETEAIDVCSKLIEKLPYCLTANRIMVDILRGSQRIVEAQPYLERVEELDPYAAQVDVATVPDTVAAETVMLDQLQTETRSAQPVPRSWTASLEMPADQAFEKEELPDWLSADNLTEAEVAPEEVPVPEEKEESVLGSLYGLDPSPIIEQPADPTLKKSNTAAFVEDQVPDWLRELRPATGSISLPEDEAAAPPELEKKTWTDELKSEEVVSADDELSADARVSVFGDEQIGAPEKEIETPAPSAEEEENLSWLEGLAAKQGAAEEELLTEPQARQDAVPEFVASEGPKPKSDALAWLDELAEDGEPAAAVSSHEASEPTGESLPAFTEEPTEEEPISQAKAESTTPDWLRDLSETAEEPQALEPITQSKAESATPEWLRDLSEAADEPQAEEPIAQSKAEGATPDWLRDLSAAAEVPQAEEPIAPRPLEEAPDWLSELRPQAQEEDAESGEQEAEEELVWQPTADLSKLDWLEESGQPVEAAPVESVWVPETAAAGDTGTSLPEPEPSPQPAALARRTARLKTMDLAPGLLEQARQALNYGKLSDAADNYGYLLRRRVMLDEIIADLTAAVRRHPQDVTLWQTLGDAFMRNNQLREALDCYTKAQDLI